MNFTIHLWAADTGTFQQTIRRSDWPVVFSPDNQIIATAYTTWDHGKILKLHDTTTGAFLTDFHCRENFVSPAALSYDGRLLASLSGYGTVRSVHLWDTDSKDLKQIFQHRDARLVAFSSDGRLLASAGADNVIRVWAIDTGLKSTKVWGVHGSPEMLNFEVADKYIVTDKAAVVVVAAEPDHPDYPEAVR